MHIIIIGNGIAGITAARSIRKLSDHTITVISAESAYFFSRTALMYIYMGHLRWKDIEPYEAWFWEKNKINLLNDLVTSVHPQQKSISTASGKELTYDALILATGSVSNKLNVTGENLDGVSSLYSLQDLQYIESKSKGIRKAVIAGGGLIGIELAEMFRSRNIEVTMLVRESSYSNNILPAEESMIVNNELLAHGIDLRLAANLDAIEGDERGRVKSVITSTGEKINCEFVGITVGVQPNIKWLASSSIRINKGVLVDPFLRTNVPDVYAIGDCAEVENPSPGRQSIEPLWYTGRIMGETVAETICGTLTPYRPGVWFNSAKFFTIEYQVYGEIKPTLSDSAMSLYWQHPKGKKSIRINYTADHVIGFNLIGIRFRQEVCEKWINGKYSIEDVLASLELALFDQEFSDNYAIKAREAYLLKTGRTILPKEKKSYNRVSAFLKNIQSHAL